MDQKPTEPQVASDTDSVDSGSDIGIQEMPFPPFPLEDPSLLGQVLDSILSDYLQYTHSDGTTLNIADILLLLKQSLDRNTEVQTQLLQELTKATSAKTSE